MTNDFLTIRNVYFRGIVSIEFKTAFFFGSWLPLISGFLLPRREEKRREEKRREGRDSREGRRKREGLSERRSSPGGEFVVFDDGSIRLIRLLRSGDWRFESERKR